ncbi:MAG: sensor histidine kinase [Bacteroidales bacterium]
MDEHFLSDINLVDKYSRHKILFHVGYWTVLVCFFGFFWGTFDNNFAKTFTIELAELPVKLMVVYTTLYYLMPIFLLKKRYNWFLILLFALLIAGGLLQRVVNFYITEPIYFPERLGFGYNKITFILTSIIGLSTVMTIPCTAKLLKFWYTIQQRYQMLEKENLRAEIAFLKSQVHPHFLFNTLNSLYALTLKKSEKSPEVVMRLSDLMHYMLYDANQPLISLNKELEFIQNYISLEEIRFENRFKLNFSVNGNTQGCLIAPLILLPFVENSFKHGVNQVSKNGWLKFNLNVNEKLLTFTLENNTSLQASSTNAGEGIGLKNVKRRLDLLYPERYKLEIKKEEDNFKVFLQLKLAV